MGPPNPSIEKVPLNIHSKPKQQRSLTLVDRRAKGLCYFCDEPYSAEHSSVHKKLQIHVMEMNDEEDDTKVNSSGEEEQIQGAEPQISVNALIRVTGFRTMRITGYHQKKPLHILIDSGSTQFFRHTSRREIWVQN